MNDDLSDMYSREYGLGAREQLKKNRGLQLHQAILNATNRSASPPVENEAQWRKAAGQKTFLGLPAFSGNAIEF
jgi:hypothetical protein